MLIDWFTVAAQVLNFLILVWLLKRFLYHPILDALDAREKKIAKVLSDADAKKAEAQQERDEFRHKNEMFEQQRAGLLNTATEEAKAERQRLLDEARHTAEVLLAKRQEVLRSDAHNLNQAIRRRTRQEVFSIARKALHDLATTELEERMADVFIRCLHEMDEQAKKTLTAALGNTSQPALVLSAFDLPEVQRASILKALQETFSPGIKVRFETSKDLISGIELSAGGQKVAWSLEDYLSSLGKGVDELLNERSETKPLAQAISEADKSVNKSI